MNYLEFIKKSNLKSVLNSYYQTITPGNYISFEEFNSETVKMLNQNLPEIKADYFQSLLENIEKSKFNEEELIKFIWFFVLEPFEKEDIAEFEKVLKKINQNLNSQVPNELFLNFIWILLDNLLHEGLFNEKSDIYVKLRSNFAHLENELEAKHLLLQKIEQFI